MDPEVQYTEVVNALLNTANVTLGKPGKRGFGSHELQVNGKIFAMLSNGRLVVKLPRQLVDILVAAGEGERFDPQRNGRLMREWLVLNLTSDQDWLKLATEAMEFVASKH